MEPRLIEMLSGSSRAKRLRLKKPNTALKTQPGTEQMLPKIELQQIVHYTPGIDCRQRAWQECETKEGHPSGASGPLPHATTEPFSLTATKSPQEQLQSQGRASNRKFWTSAPRDDGTVFHDCRKGPSGATTMTMQYPQQKFPGVGKRIDAATWKPRARE